MKLDQYSDKEVFAKNIVEYETAQLKKGIINIQLDLKSFEKKYGLSSKNFLWHEIKIFIKLEHLKTILVAIPS